MTLAGFHWFGKVFVFLVFVEGGFEYAEMLVADDVAEAFFPKDKHRTSLFIGLAVLPTMTAILLVLVGVLLRTRDVH